MKSDYEWHVFCLTKNSSRLVSYENPRVFTDPTEAANYLNQLWDEGYEESNIIPVFPESEPV